MKNWTAIRERYLRDILQVRLGGLAANLARVKSFSDNSAHQDVVESLLEESKFFIEWTASDVELDIKEKLVELQIQLARWQRTWLDIWTDSVRRTNISHQAQIWSERIL